MSPASGRQRTGKARGVNGHSGAIRFVPRGFGTDFARDGRTRRARRSAHQEPGQGTGALLAGLATAGAGIWAFLSQSGASKAAKRDDTRQRRFFMPQQASTPREVTLRVPEGWTWDDVRSYFQNSPFLRPVATASPERIIPLGREAMRVTEEQLIPAGILAARTAGEQIRPLSAQAVQVAREQLVPMGKQAAKTAQEELLPRGAEALRIAQEELLPRGAEAARAAGEQVGMATAAAGEALRRTVPKVQARLAPASRDARSKAARRALSKGLAEGAASAGNAVVAPVGSALGRAGSAILRLPLLLLGAIWGLFWSLFRFTFKLAMFAGLVGIIFYLYLPEPEQRQAFFDRAKGYWDRMTGASQLEDGPRPLGDEVALHDPASEPTWANGEQHAG